MSSHEVSLSSIIAKQSVTMQIFLRSFVNKAKTDSESRRNELADSFVI